MNIKILTEVSEEFTVSITTTMKVKTVVTTESSFSIYKTTVKYTRRETYT